MLKSEEQRLSAVTDSEEEGPEEARGAEKRAIIQTDNWKQAS